MKFSTIALGGILLAGHTTASAQDTNTPKENARFIAEYLKNNGSKERRPLAPTDFGIPAGVDITKLPHITVYKIKVDEDRIEYVDTGLPDGGADGKIGPGDRLHLSIDGGLDFFSDYDVDGKLSLNSKLREATVGFDNHSPYTGTREREKQANEKYAAKLSQLRTHLERMLK